MLDNQLMVAVTVFKNFIPVNDLLQKPKENDKFINK